MNQQALSELLLRLNSEVQQTNQRFPTNLVRGWPIPLFGDILHARVLTVGVNPSDKEFSPHRRWDAVTNPEQWQTRLLNYFQNPEVRPWIWFETWSMCLTLLELSYAGGGAAHIDVSPRSTIPMLDRATNAPEFRDMVEHDVKWFFQLLSELTQVQLLLVAGPIPKANGSKQQLADFIREHAGDHGAEWIAGEPLPKLVTAGHPKGIPVFVCPFEPNVDGLYAMVRHVHRSRELLLRLSAPPANVVPIMPTRLDWPSAIGNFMLNFGTLEYFVYVFMKDRLPEAEFERLKKWHLKDRCAEIVQYLKETKRPQSEQDAFVNLVKRADPVRELRNQIAHGHMNLRLDLQTRAPVLTLVNAKDFDAALLPDTKHLEFSEVEAALETVADLTEEFSQLAGFKDEKEVK